MNTFIPEKLRSFHKEYSSATEGPTVTHRTCVPLWEKPRDAKQVSRQVLLSFCLLRALPLATHQSFPKKTMGMGMHFRRCVRRWISMPSSHHQYSSPISAAPQKIPAHHANMTTGTPKYREVYEDRHGLFCSLSQQTAPIVVAVCCGAFAIAATTMQWNGS